MKTAHKSFHVRLFAIFSLIDAIINSKRFPDSDCLKAHV